MSRLWDAIASYMNDEIREQVHMELSPCTKREFLARYLELDPDFDDLLFQEFSINGVDDLAEYTVIHVGGDDDGKVIEVNRDEGDAILAARDYAAAHEDDEGFLGVSIYDIDGKEIENWM